MLQNKLFETYVVQPKTITVDISTLHPLVHEKTSTLPPYQVRPIQKYFLEQLIKQIKTIGATKKAVPSILKVDPKMCATRAAFVMAKKNHYRYYVVSGNHSTCAQIDLAKANLRFDALHWMQAWIVAGLIV
jgi:hypothetical protein